LSLADRLHADAVALGIDAVYEHDPAVVGNATAVGAGLTGQSINEGDQ
jgi:hypothetical protein